MSNDLSDEAFWEWRKTAHNFTRISNACLEGWQECRRRAEAMIEERERKAFEAGTITGAKMVYCDDKAHRMEVKENDWRAYQAERSGQ
jgi:hypothetical protein